MKAKKLISLALALILTLALVPSAIIANADETAKTEYEVKFIVEPTLEFDTVNAFNQGVAVVSKGGKFGVIDKTGKEIVKIEYDEIRNFTDDGIASIRKGDKWGYADNTGKIIVPPTYEDHEDWGVNRNDMARDFKDGVARVKYYDGDGNLFHYIDTSGKVVLTLEKVYNALNFSEDLASVAKWADDGEELIVGYIDKNGDIVIPFTSSYTVAIEFCDGLAMVGKETDGVMKYGCIDKTGKVVIPMEYDAIGVFSDGLIPVKKGGKDGFVDKTGKVVIPMEYDIVAPFTDGLAAVKKSDKFGYIDKSGKIVVPLEYDAIGVFGDGLLNVKKGDKDGFVDNTGKVVIPIEYETVNSFMNGVAAVKKGDKWGFIDNTGKVIIPMEYDGFSRSFIDIISVRIEQKRGLIDNSGKLLLPMEYDEHIIFGDDEVAPVKKDGKWGIIEITKVEVSEPDEPEPDEEPEPEEPDIPAEPADAAPSSMKVLVNGEETAFDAYLINDSNYFKLRDLAFVLNGTEKQFGVDYDADKNAIILTSNEAYTVIGGEMTLKEDRETVKGLPSPQKVYLNGKEVKFAVYNIGGNNYFKLRDVMKTFDVYVGYDDATKTVTLDTSKGYVD